MKLLSVIIPAHNCSETIERLLDSIKIQSISKDQLEIIIINDNSTDNFQEKLQYYEDLDINIFDISNEYKIHCPGNTRRDGILHANGKWITFIDHDDMFEENAFQVFQDAVDAVDYTTVMIWANLREYHVEDGGWYGREYNNSLTWLHGKFYRKEFLDSYDINFLADMESHEDLYFNRLCEVYMAENNLNWYRLDDFIYKWVYMPNSESHKYDSNKYGFIEVYLQDYINALIYPLIQTMFQYKNTDNNAYYYTKFLDCLLHCYMYFQASAFKNEDDEILEKNIRKIKTLINTIKELFNINILDIITSFYSNPANYDTVKQNCIIGSCDFIESISLKDFLARIDSMEEE